MSSYAADLAAIFSDPYESTETGVIEEMKGKDVAASCESPKAKEEPRKPLMTSTPYVKPQSNEDSSASKQSTPHREDYMSIDVSDADVVQMQLETEPNANGTTSGSPKGGTPKGSPSLNIVANPLNAMANSIAEAFKKRSPTTSHASFVISTNPGNKCETSLKYTPLTFDDEEQLPICVGSESRNLNANNNNSAVYANEAPAGNRGHTTYGAALNQGGNDGSGRGGAFADRISFRSPLSVFAICLCILLIFVGIICLSAIGNGAKRRNHMAQHGEHHREHRGENHGEHHVKTENILHKERGHALAVKFPKQKAKMAKFMENRRAHIPYASLIEEMKRISHSNNLTLLRIWEKELIQQLSAVRRVIELYNAKNQEMGQRNDRRFYSNKEAIKIFEGNQTKEFNANHHDQLHAESVKRKSREFGGLEKSGSETPHVDEIIEALDVILHAPIAQDQGGRTKTTNSTL